MRQKLVNTVEFAGQCGAAFLAIVLFLTIVGILFHMIWTKQWLFLSIAVIIFMLLKAL